MSYLIDTHAHLLERYYPNNLKDVVISAIENNVKRMINITINEKDFDEVIELSNAYNEVFCTLGFHPQDVLNVKDEHILKMKSLISNHNVVAVGEIGFDMFRNKSPELLTKQRELFHIQVKIAQENNLPIILHSREATNISLEHLKMYPGVRKVVHCFSENEKVMNEYIDIPNTYVSFTGILTFKNAKVVHEAFKKCPDNLIMFETDSPYLAPTPFRGKTNKPEYVNQICEHGAMLKDISFQKMMDIALENTYKFFDKLR